MTAISHNKEEIILSISSNYLSVIAIILSKLNDINPQNYLKHLLEFILHKEAPSIKLI